jgi:hypothetical protein
VKFNNALGRIYFCFVRLFHRLIVPLMVKASVQSIEQPIWAGLIATRDQVFEDAAFTLTPAGTLPILEVHAVFAIRAFLPLPSRNVNR